jgi:hypothetical protein
MKSRTPEELKQIAIDLRAGRIWSDRHDDGRGLDAFSMLFLLADDAFRASMKENLPGFVFEYLEKAGPRSVNDQPRFFSMQMLSRPDTEKMFENLRSPESR